MLGLSRPSPLKFLDYKLEELSIAEEDGQSVERKIQAMALYQEYDRWCKMEGVRTIMSNTKFGLSLATAKIEKKRNKYGYYYSLEKPHAENP